MTNEEKNPDPGAPGTPAVPPAVSPAAEVAANEPTELATLEERQGATATKTPPKKPKNVSRPVTGLTVVQGSALSARINERTAGGSIREYIFWVGAFAQCPVESLNIGGVNFPKVNEILEADPRRNGKRKRIPQIGALVRLRAEKLEILRDRISRTVLRFRDGDHEEAGTGDNIGMAAQRAKRGYPITIPTEAELKLRRENGYTARPYVPEPELDRDAADYIFCILCDDQGRPARGSHYPDPVSVTGISWPSEDEAALAAFLN